MVEKRGLGRGLSALLGEAAPPPPPPPGSVTEIPIHHIHRFEAQPRARFTPEEMEALTESIRANGVLQPILVRAHPYNPDHFELIAGERRWQAAQRAGLHAIPALIRQMTDVEQLEAAIAENVQRESLTPMEEAYGYHSLVERYGRTQAEVAQAMGKSRPHVANAIRLLSLPPEVQGMVSESELSAGHARALLGAPDPLAAAQLVVQRGLSVRETEALVKRLQSDAETGSAPRPSTRAARKDADIQALEADLSAALGLKVEIVDRDGQGEVRVRYAALEQLDEICRRLSRR
ncbi:MAG: ParB/RepB/Spo0J family partition protein [Phenylobacterium sp.]|uniref:ParB/RepB/Spo0J family partition protein n=1 Tax=Phenylobacterium sp. TaxID=1871053 RepID=UPI0025D5525B|nr:ParB/RepB/Spo0J family partition protein [Phenylobacterium sp.]MCA6224623.1 ParB/RepB/Spo0J family partition protein [Phenylobacterium sp.]MCA6256941.1 ParB/RepB/Spo0J family partition protein [Phenylobacterium sp.]MCA6308422.1 ParB/RepB/Spo0J family partition protein [Phenylobacterium sp.]